MEIPPIRYTTTSDGVSLAYMVGGNGAQTIVQETGQPSHIEANFTLLGWVGGYEQYVEAGKRFITYDHRGSGLSARDIDEVSLETMVTDLAAVIDEAGNGPVILSGFGQGAGPAIAFAHRHPETIDGLILEGAAAHGGFVSAEQSQALLTLVEDNWAVGARTWADITAGSDQKLREAFARYFRLASDGAMFASYQRIFF